MKLEITLASGHHRIRTYRQHFTERAATYTGGQGDTVEVMIALAAPGPVRLLDWRPAGLVASVAAEISGAALSLVWIHRSP